MHFYICSTGGRKQFNSVNKPFSKFFSLSFIITLGSLGPSYLRGYVHLYKRKVSLLRFSSCFCTCNLNTGPILMTRPFFIIDNFHNINPHIALSNANIQFVESKKSSPTLEKLHSTSLKRKYYISTTF